MISEVDFRILNSIRNAGNVLFSDNLPPFFTPLRMEHLVASGYLHRVVHPSGIAVYQLLPAGEDAISEFQQELDRRASEEAKNNLQNELQDKRWRKDARRSWVQFTITAILSIASFFTGAIIEVLTGFMEWISLLH